MKTHELLIQPDRKGESQFTRAFLQYLQGQYSASSGRRTGRMHSPLRTAQSRIALIWDGASYHRSREVKSYLDSVNQGLEFTPKIRDLLLRLGKHDKIWLN